MSNKFVIMFSILFAIDAAMIFRNNHEAQLRRETLEKAIEVTKKQNQQLELILQRIDEEAEQQETEEIL